MLFITFILYIYFLMQTTQWWKIFGEIECLALIIGCLCHDLDHRGTNNSFQIKFEFRKRVCLSAHWRCYRQTLERRQSHSLYFPMAPFLFQMQLLISRVNNRTVLFIATRWRTFATSSRCALCATRYSRTCPFCWMPIEDLCSWCKDDATDRMA